jgi:hypothetical protein
LKQISNFTLTFENCDSITFDWEKYKYHLFINNIVKNISVIGENEVYKTCLSKDLYIVIPNSQLNTLTKELKEKFSNKLAFKDITSIGLKYDIMKEDNKIACKEAWYNVVWDENCELENSYQTNNFREKDIEIIIREL